MIEIKTDRLILKKPKTKQDKLLLVSQIGDWEVVKWLATVPYPYTYNDCEDYLKISNNDELALNIFLDNKLIGGVGLDLHNDNYYDAFMHILLEFGSGNRVAILFRTRSRN